MRTKCSLACAVALFMAAAFVAATVPVVAHHAFGGEFDANRPVLIKGKVSKVEWVNPHAWIHIAATDVTIAGQKQDLKGATTEWAIEGGTPNTLLRRGITRDALSGSPEVIVEGYQTRDHTLQRANGRNIVFADGRKLFMGSSGTGAPADGADPAEPGRR